MLYECVISYIISSEDGQVEGQQLEWDDAEDPLQAVHAVRHFNSTARVLYGLVVVLVTDHYGTTLKAQHATTRFTLADHRTPKLRCNLVNSTECKT